MAWRWQQLLAVRGVHERVPWLTRTYFVSYAWGQILPTVGRRRRVAHLRDGAAPSRADHADHRLGAARARARRRGDAAARRRRLPARDRPVPDRRLPLARGDLRRRRRSLAGRRLLLAQPCAGGSRSRCRSRGGCGSRRPRGPSTRASTATATTRGRCSSSAAVTRRDAADARCSRSTRRAGRSASTSRCCPYIVLGPLLFLVMLVPFTVNGLGVREAFFVSFLGNLGRERRRGVRVRLPLLRDDDPARAARARRDPLGAGVRPAPRDRRRVPERSG